jgi:hypothetical protein
MATMLTNHGHEYRYPHTIAAGDDDDDDDDLSLCVPSAFENPPLTR